MKIKIIGFKVGRSRPTANRTIDRGKFYHFDGAYTDNEKYYKLLASVIDDILRNKCSDFISIRRVDD